METTDPPPVSVQHFANAAGMIAEAVERAGARDLAVLESMYGRATVVLDGDTADVHLHDRGVSVHVRFDDR